ncbi:MAG TPA: family 43 glycosylhydrolase [Pyrinomonadaceae bacterium]|jgi:beta-xylosidase
MRNRFFITQAFCLASLTIALLLGAHPASAQPAAFHNPVIAGDYPDPSVIRVGADYWATATTSEWAPEFPLLHSRDMVNWEQVGAVFAKRPAWSTGNYWAPEISAYRGRYFVFYVGHKKGGSLCVAMASANRPSGPYTDHGPLVCQDAGSIDAMAVTDEGGARYLIWKEDGNSRNQPTPIWAQRLSDDGAKLTGERKEILRNDAAWEAQLVEGPFVLRRDGWFYLFYSGNACCGRECNYALGVARSRKLLGPYEKNPANPILKGNEAWKCPGHGSIVETAKGRDFLLYHAYNASDFVYVGRQALLDEVRWESDGWPTINGGRGPSGQALSPKGARVGTSPRQFFDDFRTTNLQAGWQWPQDNEPVKRLDAGGGGWLALSPQGGQENNLLSAVLARSTVTGNYVAVTEVDARALKPGAQAGLAAYGDGENALGVSVTNGKVTVWRREKNSQQEIASTTLASSAKIVWLRLTAREGHLFRFAVSIDGRSWREVGQEVDGSYLPPWDRGVRVALVAGGTANAVARFGSLRITPSR